MPHITSSWAPRYCLVDPAVQADEIRAADSTAARAAGELLSAIGDAAREAEHPLARASRTVAEGWSAQQPTTASVALVAAFATTDRSCAALTGAATCLTAALGTAHHAVREAYEDADAAIASRDLLDYRQEWVAYPGAEMPIAVITPEERHRVDSGRTDVVATLGFAVGAAHRSLTDGAVVAGRMLPAEPWAGLPASILQELPRGTAATDRTNRQALAADLASADARRRELAASVILALDDAAARGQTAQLLVYDPDDPPAQGAVAISLGNLDTAADVAVVVPGVGNSPTAIGDSLATVGRLGDEVQQQGGRDRGPTATVLWFGYDIPASWPSDAGTTSLAQKIADSGLALNAVNADTAADRLRAFTGTLRTVIPQAASLTLIGHSWGSIVVSQALRKMGRSAGVSRAVSMGSPGAGYLVSTANDYAAVDASEVYVVALPGDPVPTGFVDSLADTAIPLAPMLRRKLFGADPGPYGVDPAAPDFGATVIDVPSAHRAAFGYSLANHSLDNYLDGESLAAVAAVVAGNGAEVPVRAPK